MYTCFKLTILQRSRKCLTSIKKREIPLQLLSLKDLLLTEAQDKRITQKEIF